MASTSYCARVWIVETRALRELAHLIEHALRPAHEFTGSQQLGTMGDTRWSVSGENNHPEQDGTPPLGIDEDGVVATGETVEQTDPAETTAGGIEQQLLQLAPIVSWNKLLQKHAFSCTSPKLNGMSAKIKCRGRFWVEWHWLPE